MRGPSSVAATSATSSSLPFIKLAAPQLPWWRQRLALEDGDLIAELLVVRESRWRVWLVRIGSVLTLGLLWLILHWLPVHKTVRATCVPVNARHVEHLHANVISGNGTRHARCCGDAYANHEDDSVELFTSNRSSSVHPSSNGSTERLTGDKLGPNEFHLSDSLHTRDMTPFQVRDKIFHNSKVFLEISNSWGSTEVVPLLFQNYPGATDVIGIVDGGVADASRPPYAKDGGFMFFTYRSQHFVYDPPQDRFVDNLTNQPVLPDIYEGLTKCSILSRQLTFGKNVISVPKKSTLELLLSEVLHPFFCFQIFSIILWCLDEYYYYAICIFVISLVSTAAALRETKRQHKRISNLAYFDCSVRILRGGNWEWRRSNELVPGDLIQVNNLTDVPCDILLAAGGDCIVNESMLTGESTPVFKNPLPKHHSPQDFIGRLDLRRTQLPSSVSKHIIFGGTELVQVRRRNAGGQWKSADRVIALCIRTGFRTTRGALIRSMLHPKPHDMRFFRDSFRFIMFLAALAFMGFIYSVYTFMRQGAGVRLILLRGLDLLTIIVPPALPATLTIGMSFAINRLMTLHNMFCTSPQRINLCGKVNLVCFDKTGTLTEDGLQILGVQAAGSFQSSGPVPELAATMSELPRDWLSMGLANCLRTCHHLKIVHGKLVGDPLDVQMFEFTGWELDEESEESDDEFETMPENGSDAVSLVKVRPREPGTGSPGPPELEIVCHFEFVSWLMRASVIVVDHSLPLHSSGRAMVYTKGAPEVIRNLCKASSIPVCYDDWLEVYTRNGYRVIACAGRSYMPPAGLSLADVELHKVVRSDIEFDLEFMGFIIFENPLKHDSPGAIQTLTTANISCKICTGDNVRTAISVGRGVGLFGNEPVFTSTLQEEECEAVAPQDPAMPPGPIQRRRRLVFTKEDDPHVLLDVTTMTPIYPPRSPTLNVPQGFPAVVRAPGRSGSVRIDMQPSLHSASLAVTGPCYDFMIAQIPQHDIDRILVKSKVFARMSPDQKQDLVERYQDLGYTTCFCGDGANDCQALKAAHVGLSLSEAEASIAAPFTSRQFTVEAVVHLIREGRAALVTSFSCFKFMALYSLIQFTSVTLLYACRSNLGDIQFLYIDLIIILPLAIFMGRIPAYPRLVPKRPTSDLFSPKVLVSLLGHVVLQLVLQVSVLFAMTEQAFYRPVPEDGDDEDQDAFHPSYENVSLFVLTCHVYTWAATVCSVGKPYRESLWSYKPYVAIVGALTILTLLITFHPPGGFGPDSFFKLLFAPVNWRITITLVSTIGYASMAKLCETYIFPKIARWFKRRQKHRKGKMYAEKRYKRIANETGIR